MTNTDRLAQALLPCPFCGSTESLHIDCEDGRVFSVVCSIHKKGCGSSSVYDDTEEKVVAAWNRRAAIASLAPAAVDQRIDAWHAVWERISKHSPAFAWPHSTGQEAVLAWIDGQAAQVAALAAQCEGLRKDAERYRWLRSHNVRQSQLSNLHNVINDDCNPPYIELKHEVSLDAAIDSAIAAGNGEGV